MTTIYLIPTLGLLLILAATTVILFGSLPNFLIWAALKTYQFATRWERYSEAQRQTLNAEWSLELRSASHAERQ